jgi:hypothetical protein
MRSDHNKHPLSDVILGDAFEAKFYPKSFPGDRTMSSFPVRKPDKIQFLDRM